MARLDIQSKLVITNVSDRKNQIPTCLRKNITLFKSVCLSTILVLYSVSDSVKRLDSVHGSLAQLDRAADF